MNNITYEISNKIAFITLNRPEKKNALNSKMVTELIEAFDKAEEDDHVKVIILRASGNVFCSGLDLEYLQTLQNNSYHENFADSSHIKNLYFKIYTLSKVVIAQVQGHAIAGGCGLATVCDFVYTSENAKFGYTEVKIGFVPSIIKVFLLRKMGETHAKELLLTGDLISSEKALNIGLINKVFSEDTLAEEVEKFATRLCLQNSAQSMAWTKKMITEMQDKSLPEGLFYSVEMNVKALNNTDCKKGISAFLNKIAVAW